MKTFIFHSENLNGLGWPEEVTSRLLSLKEICLVFFPQNVTVGTASMLILKMRGRVSSFRILFLCWPNIFGLASYVGILFLESIITFFEEMVICYYYVITLFFCINPISGEVVLLEFTWNSWINVIYNEMFLWIVFNLNQNTILRLIAKPT